MTHKNKKQEKLNEWLLIWIIVINKFTKKRIIITSKTWKSKNTKDTKNVKERIQNQKIGNFKKW